MPISQRCRQANGTAVPVFIDVKYPGKNWKQVKKREFAAYVFASSPGLDAEVVHQKRINIRSSVQGFAGIAGSMAGLRFDPDQHRMNGAGFLLQGSRVL